MANTPPPPPPAPVPEQTDDVGSSSNQGGLDRDVNSILANLNSEQLASIVAAARASEGNADGNPTGSGVDVPSILAALPPGLGQAASALTSFASSFKRDNETGAPDRAEHEGAEEEHGQTAVDEAAAEQQAPNGDATEEHHQQNTDGVAEDEEKKHAAADESVQEHSHIGDDSELPGDQTTGTAVDETTEEYRNEQTQAAIAAMESLAAQSGLQIKGAGRAKRDTGPEAERVRKDQHKEVERKRREQISNGITDLANIVPGCDNKGINKTAIINAAVRYIAELKDNEASNIEKWTLEKLLMDQAMGDLSAQLDASRKEISRLRAQLGLPDEPEQYAEEGAEAQQEQEHEHEHEHEHGHEHDQAHGQVHEHEQEHEQEHDHQEGHGEEHHVEDHDGTAAGADVVIDTAMDDAQHSSTDKTAQALTSVAEAAVAAAHENGEEELATTTDTVAGDSEGQDGKTSLELPEHAEGEHTMEADLAEAPGRAKRARHA